MDLVSKPQSKQAVAKARDLLRLAAPLTLPVDLAHLAKLQGINAIRIEPLDSADAELVPSGVGYVIRVNSAATPSRQRFSIAHEIGHSFYPRETTAYRNASVALQPRQTHQIDYRQEERLCDIIATELLMPRSSFIGALRGGLPSIAEIERLAGVFHSSALATSARYAELCGRTIQLNRWTKVSNRIRPWPSGERMITLEEFDRNDPESDIEWSVAAAFDSGHLQRRIDRITNAPYQLSVEAKGFGRGQNRYVLSLLISSSHP